MVYSSHHTDTQRILQAPRLRIGQWPTPLEPCAALPALWIKRDDLSGFGRGGVKTRKLEFFLGYFLERNIRSLVIVVPNLSNLRADIEAVAEKLDLNIHFIVANDPPLANRSLTDTAFIRYHMAGKSMISVAWQLLYRYLKVKRKEKKTAMILPGACHPSAVLGTAAGLLEMVDQCREQHIPPPRHVFISASGGSSAAGLVLASLLLREQGIADICVHVTRVYPIPLKWWIRFLLLWTRRRFGLQIKIKNLPVRIWKEKIAYGEHTAELEECCSAIKEKWNLNVDHIYGARTWTAMQKFAANEYKGDGLVFWHCGFTPDAGLFKPAAGKPIQTTPKL
jgi:1-aminocyclopropane-1-carboxylate deaminase/D-cysteine desulfhydrase-like pyridoxal-dependent ACC family enzyme